MTTYIHDNMIYISNKVDTAHSWNWDSPISDYVSLSDM